LNTKPVTINQILLLAVIQKGFHTKPWQSSALICCNSNISNNKDSLIRFPSTWWARGCCKFEHQTMMIKSSVTAIPTIQEGFHY
jgi:hypothetical protein